MTEEMIQKIECFYRNNPLLLKARDVGKISNWDLLFLIPNNKKKMLHLPLTRTRGSNKRSRKATKKRRILTFGLFDVFEEAIEDTIGNMLNDEYFFDGWATFEDVKLEAESRGDLF